MRSAAPDFSIKKRGLSMRGDPIDPEEKLRHGTSLRENSK
jgi:hypothetical protein